MNTVDLLTADGWEIVDLDYTEKREEEEDCNVYTVYFLEKDGKKLRVIDLLLAPTTIDDLKGMIK